MRRDGGRERKRELTSLSESLALVLRQTGLAARLEAQPVFDAYRTAVGDGRARQAKAVRLRDGVLEVAVSSSALLHELRHFHTERILKQIQKSVREPRVESIRFRLATERGSR